MTKAISSGPIGTKMPRLEERIAECQDRIFAFTEFQQRPEVVRDRDQPRAKKRA